MSLLEKEKECDPEQIVKLTLFMTMDSSFIVTQLKARYLGTCIALLVLGW